MTKPIEFELRPATIGPLRMGTRNPGDAISEWEPDVGDTASVRYAGVTIFARIVLAVAREYRGEIIGIERWDEEYFKGMKVGDTVAFSFAQTFGFGKL